MRILILTFLTIALFSSEATAARQPNILWIVGENFALDLACYGQKNVKTPHLDALASRGVKYMNVFATSPVCAPSRSAFMVGMYQTSTDTHHMRSHRDDDYRLPKGVRPLTHRLKDAGYVTANIKMIGDQIVGTSKLDLNFVNEGPIYDSNKWSAISQKNSTQKKPFFAQINLPVAEYDIYDRKSAEKPRVKWVGEEWYPQVANANNVTPPPYYPKHKVVREEWARYLNSVSGADVLVGKILDQLKKDGLADDTIVIFFGDNGRLDARGIHWPFDSGLHVPMIISYPKNFPAPKQIIQGISNDDIISLIDLTATTLWMAGIERPIGMQGRLFLGDDANAPRHYAFAARDRIDETVVRMRSVSDKRYHYIRNFTPGAGFLTLNRYKEKCFLVKPLMRKLHKEGKLTGAAANLMKPFPKEMLFDTKADPHEINNLATSNKKEDHEALIRLRAALDTWMTETNDRGAIPEPASTVAPFLKEMDAWFGTPEWAK